MHHDLAFGLQPGDHPADRAVADVRLPRDRGRRGPAPGAVIAGRVGQRSSTRRSLPDVGEFAHTQFITAMLIALAVRCGEPQARGRVSDSGNEKGAEGRWQAPSTAAYVPARAWLTCADVHKQAENDPVCLADKEGATGSIQGPVRRPGHVPSPLAMSHHGTVR